MKKIWIFQAGEPLHIDGFDSRPMRAMNLANFFVKKKFKVVLWSSDFYHQKKIHRTKAFKSIKINSYLKIQLIPSMGYYYNISFKRIFDHIQLAFNLSRILKNNKYETPDFLIIGFPPIESSFVFLKWAQKNNVRTILDVKDQWPEIFISPFPKYLRLFVRFLLQPYFMMLLYQIRNADYISTISVGFQNWIDTLNTNKEKKKNLLVPLTSPPVSIKKSKYNDISKWWSKNGLVKGKKTICFVGSLSRAFDFKPINTLIEYLLSMNLDINFVICGLGEQNRVIKKMMCKYDNVFFPGWINVEQIKVLYDNSYFMLAPYKNFKDFKLSIPNKIYDALSNGLPVLTPLDGEVKQLIDKYEVGIHYKNEKDLCLKFYRILTNDKVRDSMSVNAKKLFNKNYNFDLVYNKFLEIID